MTRKEGVKGAGSALRKAVESKMLPPKLRGWMETPGVPSFLFCRGGAGPGCGGGSESTADGGGASL